VHLAHGDNKLTRRLLLRRLLIARLLETWETTCFFRRPTRRTDPESHFGRWNESYRRRQFYDRQHDSAQRGLSGYRHAGFVSDEWQATSQAPRGCGRSPAVPRYRRFVSNTSTDAIRPLLPRYLHPTKQTKRNKIAATPAPTMSSTRARGVDALQPRQHFPTASTSRPKGLLGNPGRSMAYEAALNYTASSCALRQSLLNKCARHRSFDLCANGQTFVRHGGPTLDGTSSPRP